MKIHVEAAQHNLGLKTKNHAFYTNQIKVNLMQY